MIFFGRRAKVIAGEAMEGIECPECGNGRFMTFGVLRYFHLYWIPTFPVSRKPGIECSHCKNTLVDKELSSDLAKHIRGAVFTPAVVWPRFSGLILIAAALLVAGVMVVGDRNRQASWVQDPAVNDIYVVDMTQLYEDADRQYPYGALKVERVADNGVEVQVPQYVYDVASGVRDAIDEREIWADDYFHEDTIFLAADRLQSMREKEIIRSVVRP